MSSNQGDQTKSRTIDFITPLTYPVSQPTSESSTKPSQPAQRELPRYIERQRARDLGYELPLNTSEAAGRRGLIANSTMLINESVMVMGLSIWGSPTTPLVDGAFGLISNSDRARLYEQIPNDTNIVITHGPPYGVLDQAPGSDYHAGCRQLLSAMQRVKPRLHVFGHAHGCYGMVDTPETLFANVALLGSDGNLSNAPVVFQMKR